MTLSHRPLGYCSNVHAGLTTAAVVAGWDEFTVPVQRALGHPVAAGLWLAAPVIRELHATPDALPRFVDELHQRELSCYTLNAFPYGDFHSARVKENVYLPDWTDPQRLEYTANCARVLAACLQQNPRESDKAGSISTVPLGFKGFEVADDFEARAITNIISLARQLQHLRDETGCLIRLAIEPEPFCRIETTPEAVGFFERLWTAADAQEATAAVRTHIGLCYDVCHQAVEFEDITQSLADLTQAGVPLVKIHITCAIHLDRPMENPTARTALEQYVEPRYLHQTMGRLSDGSVARLIDLTADAARNPAVPLSEADAWRVHFHVPVDADSLGPLQTTRPQLREALGVIAGLDETPDLEVETYTWAVLPGGKTTDLVTGLTRELAATQQLLADAGSATNPA